MSKKSRFKKFLRRQKESEEQEKEQQPAEANKEAVVDQKQDAAEKKGFVNFFTYIYERKYKQLMIIPFVMLIAAIVLIAVQYSTTGDFMNRAVSLKGGITITVPFENAIDTSELKEELLVKYPQRDFSIRSLTSAGSSVGLTVETDVDMTDKESIEELIAFIGNKVGRELVEGDYSIEGTGASLGSSFFKETIIALLIAFICMSIVVFISFRVPVPSMAVILAAFSDIVVTLAIVNLMGMRISTAGIAAFLMLIGYSVDTDILLSTRVLKRKEGTVLDRVYGSIKTGMTMLVTTMVAVVVALIFAQSEVIRQIMTIIFIGLIVDVFNTWIQNAGILRWYLEKKDVKD